MKKIIIDCNIFDKMIFDKDLLLQSLGEYEYFIISIQYDELKKSQILKMNGENPYFPLSIY